MAELAIKGHATRGNEVIEILEMLGGKNTHNYDGDRDIWYVLTYNTIEITAYLFEEKGFTLEKFLERYPYKVGDRVRVPEYESEVRIDAMKWDGFEIQYSVSADETEYLYEWYSAEELNKCNEPRNKEIMEETNKAIFEGNMHCCDIMNDIIKDNIEERKYDELRMPLVQDYKLATEATIDGNKITSPENYLIGKVTQLDNGMLVEFVKKQPKYPKTYKECCEVLGITFDYPDIRDVSNVEFHLYSNFIRLIRCRDAYWKIVGEQMEFGKPWKPDWGNYNECKYCLYIVNNKVNKCMFYCDNHILAFPTEEILDAFYENFKELIDICKELL